MSKFAESQLTGAFLMRRSEVTRALYAQAPGLASDFLREAKKSARTSFGAYPNVVYALFLASIKLKPKAIHPDRLPNHRRSGLIAEDSSGDSWVDIAKAEIDLYASRTWRRRAGCREE